MRTLRVTAASAAWNGRRAVSAILRWEEDGEPRSVARPLDPDDAAPAGYRALVLALWEARRAGARRVEVSLDDSNIVAQVEGTEPPPAAAIGPYLQVRALMNAFRCVRVHRCSSAHVRGAVAAAVAAVRPRPRYADLPLWSAAAKGEAA